MCPDRNPVGWFELYTSDLSRAKAFYEAVFQLKLEPLPAPPPPEGQPAIEMLVFSMDPNKPGATGSLCKMDGIEPGGGGTLIYFSCEDCAEEESRVVPSGGQVLKSKFPIGHYGHIAIVKDTEGNCIGLHSMK